jgi:predicted cupin superfamily sugar epimerase
MRPAVHPRAAQLIHDLQLAPHPEGGYYREIFRSALTVALTDGRGPRAALTTIYFLLHAGTHSRWHRVASDEVWHLCEGGPLELLVLRPDGRELSRVRLESFGSAGGAPIYTVHAHWWQAARPVGEYALVGCTVGPGFEFADFTMLADVEELADDVRRAWPEAATLI